MRENIVSLHLRPGDRIEFVIAPDSRVVLVWASFDAADIAGALPRPKRPVSLDASRMSSLSGPHCGCTDRETPTSPTAFSAKRTSTLNARKRLP